ncbi:hypothetical protein DSM101010T_35200 [Desulfovibrio subterraneus]|uniref:ABC transporter domain-containing protein n=1 Tax=Desulfovibrio subterraneus TaxID=2718620 RepID=A0A7J0BPU2_9BACT|nr:hypothetical protein DSM101010T_35200 [Desulfovibrio subterraneus]
MFQAENYLEKELSEQLDKGAPYRALQKFYAVCPTNALEFLVIMTVGGFGAYLIIWSGMSQGAAVAMLSLLAVSGWRMVPAANKIITGFKTLEQSWPYLEKLATYISGGHREVYEDGEQAELCFDNDIRVDNLAFSYDVESLPVLSDVSFDIRKAQTTAIIGDSGAGKSTMLYLLLGLLDPTGGNILLGDRRLDATTRGAWLKRVGYVPQSPYVQTGTLAENIAFGVPKPEISIDRVMECCKLAAIDFIDELANGLDTVVGDGGVRLSGGQCQRVAIARALYRDPCVLIFDEATSALDTHNEQAVMGALMSLRGKMTMVLVTHRLDSAFACDRVVYLRKGEAVVVGAPDEIIPLYKERQVCDVGFSECR